MNEKTGWSKFSIPLNSMVGRRGIEPRTYGLRDEIPGKSENQETPSKSDNNQESQIDRPEPEVGPSEVE